MAVIFLGEVEGSSSATSTIQQKGRLYFTRSTKSRSFYVLGELADREEEILAVAGIPQLYDDISGALCISRIPEEMDSVDYQGSDYVLWIVKCKWDNTHNIDFEQGGTNPETRRPRVRWYGENEESQLYYDAIDGRPCTTEAGEFIYISHPVVRPILEITRYELPPFNPNTQLDFANHTNQYNFYGAPPGCALMMPITTSEEIIENSVYLNVNYRVKFAIESGFTVAPDPQPIFLEDGWQARPLHEGNYEVTDDGVKRIRFADGHVGRGLLDQDGKHIEPTQEIDFDNQFLAFNRFAKADFRDLSLE